MKRDLKQKIVQAMMCLVCVIIVWNYGSGLEGTEFSGGRLTGPLLDMKDIGALVFIVAMLVTFFFRRVAAAFIVTACLLCLPLYLYFTAPGPFRRLMGGGYSVPLQANFAWNRGAIIGILTLAIAASVGIRSLLVSETRPSLD